MPQLAKGGKHVFGWSRVGKEGRIVLHPDSLAEYGLGGGGKVILMSGSRTSGGFVVTTPHLLKGSPLLRALNRMPGILHFETPEGSPRVERGRTYCWARIRGGALLLPPPTLACFGVAPGGRVLSVRGSRLGISLLARGPIVEEALKYPGLRLR